MNRPHRLVVLLLPAALLLAGCVGAPPAADPAAAALPCVEPHPCGPHWPEGLDGPFELREIVHETAPGHDGIDLDGYVYLPDVPEGVKVPVILWSHPYFGQTYPSADDPRIRNSLYGLPIDALVREGYAVAAFSVRGSGNSGGCFEMFGPNEALDQAALVEWLAQQEWSNGRVGMMGLSYHGTTPWMAAIHQPPALKTIVVAGMVSDLYTFYHTPQGAAFASGPAFQALFDGLVSVAPPLMGKPDRALAPHAPVVPERACPELARTITSLGSGLMGDERDPGFWTARRLIDGFPNVTAAVLLTHGFQDQWGSGHNQQEDAAWGALWKAPKRMLVGQWGHEFPDTSSFRAEFAVQDWETRLVAWLDYWLKGVGDEAPGLGQVEYQDGAGAWRASTAWPPADARPEALYLAEELLSPAPAEGARSFRAAPDQARVMLNGGNDRPVPGPICGTPGLSLLYATEPAQEDVVVAGNPVAHLRLASDLPGGLLHLVLFDLGPEFRCENGLPVDARPLSDGAVDLRFHEGSYQAKPFPVGEPTRVRVEIANVAELIPKDHRLALLVSAGDHLYRTGRPLYPTVTVEAGGDPEASHLLVPVVEGSFGGSPTGLAYAPRPFAPQPEA